MSWANTTLSTTATLARHEQEIQRQSGGAVRWSIYVPVGTTAYFSTTEYATCTKARFTYNDDSTTGVPVSASKITLPTNKYIIKIELFATDTLLFTFECNEGYGYVLTDTTRKEVIRTETGTGAWTGWLEVETEYSWQDKIDLAKTLIGNAIEDALSSRGVVVDEAGGQVLLDTVTNPTIFSIASDYLALHLIYNDLLNASYTELIKNKWEIYLNKYKEELASGLRRMNLDPALSGTTTDYRVGFVGYVSR